MNPKIELPEVEGSDTNSLLKERLEAISGSPKLHEVNERKILIIETNKSVLSNGVLEILSQYQSPAETLPHEHQRHCAAIAADATRKLATAMNAIEFHIGSIGTNETSQAIPFYRGKGFKFHIMNYLDNGDDVCAAIDLNAGYTMDNNSGQYDIFVVTAESEDALLDKLKTLTEINWSTRD